MAYTILSLTFPTPEVAHIDCISRHKCRETVVTVFGQFLLPQMSRDVRLSRDHRVWTRDQRRVELES